MIDPKSTAGILLREHDNVAQALAYAERKASVLLAMHNAIGLDYAKAAEELREEQKRQRHSNEMKESKMKIKFNELPPIGEQLGDGIFAGLTTKKDGTHYAIVKLPGKGSELGWNGAKAWATEQGGELPSIPVAAILFYTLKGQLSPEWHWTADERLDFFAWFCSFCDGFQDIHPKNYKGSAIAVRLIPLEA